MALTKRARTRLASAERTQTIRVWVRRLRSASIGVFGPFAVQCTCDAPPEPLARRASDHSTASGAASEAPPIVLYVPDGGVVVPPDELRPGPSARGPCPADMVNVKGRYCIDRYEARLVDVEKGRRISPYYHPTRGSTAATFKSWETMRFTMGEKEAQILPLPAPPFFQLSTRFDIKAVSEPQVVPNGYLSGLIAETACKNANKRLCSEEEWVTACRGEADRKFPYGETFESGRCNVVRGVHPAALLHGSASLGHLDPRLNHFTYEGRPLLHATGTNPDCVSRWANDGIYDMVGNLDEWIDDEQGAFLGGFYSRNTKEGCQSKITAHPRAYYDYSLGVRCCL